MHRREVIKIVSTKIIQSYVKKLLNKIQNRTQKIIQENKIRKTKINRIINEEKNKNLTQKQKTWKKIENKWYQKVKQIMR